MIKGVGHIGLFVRDIEATLDGLIPFFGDERPQVVDREDLKVRYAMVDAGPIQLEIIQDYGGEGMAGKAVAEKGDHINHFCLLSDDLEGDVAAMRTKGVEFLADEPWLGVRGKRVIFSSKETTAGFPVEISEP